jgi:hypothetical protein
MARRKRVKQAPILIMASLIAVAVGLVVLNWRSMPWHPLNLAEPPGPFTRMKIAAIRDDAPSCRALLRSAGERFAVAPAVRGGANCGYADGVILSDRRPIEYRAATPVSCAAALGLVLWERHSLQAEAQLLLGSRVVAIETMGTYNCRRIGGGDSGSFSQHATANAIDIAAFRLADGRRISVLNDWKGDGPEATFLRRVRNGACGSFSTVLSPDYNAAHRDHFHFDQAQRGGWGLCR